MLIFAFAAASALMAPAPTPSVPLLKDSLLPLAGKRVLVTSPRVDAAPLTAALVSAGARPLWWPLVEVAPLPEAELETLDDVIMRLPEHSAITLISRHAVRTH